MAYKALYRTYRPQIFSDVVGQEAVVKTLQNAIINNKISHAYLFSGPRGTGKTSIARIFAKALNCVNVNNGEPCDKCDSCNEITNGISPDVIEIDAASNNGVDEIRDIREKVKYLPSGAKYKVYIIDEVHMLSGGAFNALLKTLEEPPKHVIFILATTEPQKLPATIISRCQRFEFKALSILEINYELKKICEAENVTITEEALNAISEAADGAMRDALSILDQAISYGNRNVTVDDINAVTGTLNLERVISLAKAIENKNVQETLEIINDILLKGKEISKIVDGLLVFYRDLLLYQNIGSENLNKFIFTKDEFKNIASSVPSQKVMYYIDALSDIQNKVKTSSTPNVYLEIAMIKMCNISVEDLDVLKRLNEVEEKLNNINITTTISGDSNTSINNEKVDILENRINQITGELSRLELRKQIDKLNELQAKVNYSLTNSASTSVDNQEIQYLKDKISELELETKQLHIDELDELKEKISSLQVNNASDINNISTSDLSNITNRIKSLEEKIDNTSNVDLSDIYNKISNLENKESVNNTNSNVDLTKVYNRINDLNNRINNITNNITNNSNVDLSDIYNKISNLENKEPINNSNFDLSGIIKRIADVEDLCNNKLEQKTNEIEDSNYTLSQDLEELKERVNNLEKRPNGNINNNFNADTLNEISDKLIALEKKVYQIIAGELASNKVTKKEVKRNSGQIMLFEQDILDIDDYEVNAKEKYDFGILNDETSKVDNVTNNENKVQDNIEKNQETSISQSSIKNEEQKVETSLDNNQVQEDNTQDNNDTLFETHSIYKEDTNKVVNEEPKVEKTGLFETAASIIERNEPEKKSNNIVSQYFDAQKGEEIINKELSSMVVKKKTAENYDIEKDLIARENAYDPFYSKEPAKKEEIKEEIIEEKTKEQVEEKTKGDKFSTYNIKYIEQLLYDSLSAEARNDKKRIEAIWKRMNSSVRPQDFTIIETLQEGKVVAVGAKEFIIVYPNTELCNQVMRARFKDIALRILYDAFGDKYNYIALPENVWIEKRTEFRNDYQMGIKRPKLTPINTTGLEIISSEEEYHSENEQTIDRTMRMFGNNINIK